MGNSKYKYLEKLGEKIKIYKNTKSKFKNYSTQIKIKYKKNLAKHFMIFIN